MKKLPDKVKALYKSSILIVLINLTVLCSTAFGQSTREASSESPGLKVAQDNAVIWENPGKSSMDCVPLGNGDIGLNAWTEGDSDLVFYISKTDAWDDNGRLCKVGKLRLTFSNSPFAKKPFREVLSIAKGQWLITSGDKNNKTSVRLWVDANNPVIHLESSSSKAIDIKASMELWRTEEYEIKTTVSDLRIRMGKLHKPTAMKPHMYDAAVKSFETGFPYTMTPMGIAFPGDKQAATTPNFQWMIGESLLCVPQCKNPSSKSIDVYLPEGVWFDFDTGKKFEGPQLLKNFSMPPEKTPCFVGGSGIIITRAIESNDLTIKVYPTGKSRDKYVFNHPDGQSKSILSFSKNSNKAVWDIKARKKIRFETCQKSGAISFNIKPGRSYKLEL